MGIKAFFSKLFGGSEAEETVVVQAEKPACCASESKDNGGKKARAPKASPEEQSAKLRELEGFVNYVVKALVDYPEDVVVSSESVKEGKMIQIVCRPGDRGKIIGKKGKTIMALRSLVAGAAGRLQDRVMVEVMDDENEVKA